MGRIAVSPFGDMCKVRSQQRATTGKKTVGRPAKTTAGEQEQLLMELYHRQLSASMVWAIASERFWRYQIKEEKDPTVVGKHIVCENDR